MMTENSKRYSVMDGEPHLGSVVETTYTYDRDDIVEGLIEALCDDYSANYFMLGDNEVDVSDYLTAEDVERIEEELTRELLDDDYGTEKEYGLLTALIEEMVGKYESCEFETQEYR